MARYWTCRRCSGRWQRTTIKCQTPDCEGRRPKPRVTRHAETLRDHPYEHYLMVARLLHGVADESCCVCGKPRSQDRHHDRDHDHVSGNPRGLACGGNRGCNVLMVPWVTAATAAGIAEAKYAAGEADALRWEQIAAYLERASRYTEVFGEERVA